MSTQSVDKRLQKKPLTARTSIILCQAPGVSRRTAVKLAALSIGLYLMPGGSHAASLAENAVKQNVARIKLALGKAGALITEVKALNENLGEEDYLFVLRYQSVWLEPGRVAMAYIAEQTGVVLADSDAVKRIAAATLGHLLELSMEAKGRNRDRVLRELDEYVESAEEFLALPSIQRFTK